MADHSNSPVAADVRRLISICDFSLRAFSRGFIPKNRARTSARSQKSGINCCGLKSALLLLCFTFSSGHYAPAADKSGVSPNTISLPKGPGSIEGLGESFQPTLNTGTAKYSIALKVPPGTAGHTPELRL